MERNTLLSPRRIPFLGLVWIPGVLLAGCQQDGEEMEPQDDPEPVQVQGGPVELIGEGFQFTEGPYWRDGGYLVFSDIPASIVYEWSPEEDAAPFLEPSGHANGITADPEGRLLLAQHDGRVSRLHEDGELEVLAESYDGRRLNSPNDLVMASDGSIYFTDPPYGVDEEDRELDFSGVYRIHPDGDLELLTDGYDYPNGLTFSPDESTFYVNDSNEGAIWAYDVDADGGISNERPFARPEDPDAQGTTDGMKVDVEGNLYTTGPGGVWVFSPDGEEIQRIELPVPPTNLAFGGPEATTLYITARDNVYRVPVEVPGLR